MKLLLTLSLVLYFNLLIAQDDIAKVFRDTRIVNSHSVEMQPKGTMKFIISHRFGAINSGGQQLWGLDNSRIRLGLDYAPIEALNVGIGRSSEQKNFDFFVKYQLLKQSDQKPLSLVFFTEASYITDEFRTEGLSFTNKLSYTYQLLIARKLTDRLSLQLMPTLLHRNYVTDEISDNDVYSIGAASRYQINKRIALNVEYFYILPDQLAADPIGNERLKSLGLGIEVETKGHVFQFNFTNSRDFVAPFYLGDTTGDFFDGDIHFGFNITRDFKVGSRKYN